MALLDIIKAKGFAVSKQKTTLWEEVETIATGVTKEEFDFYLSTKYEGSAFLIVRDGDESTLVALWRDEIIADNYESDENGLVDTKDVDFTVTIKVMKALRDDKDMSKPIKKGDLVLKAFVD
jgi:hypothetical protein